MTDRRFNETEVAQIFEKATELQDARRLPLPAAEGMTLAQLEDIGREVGIAPEALAHAVQVVDRGDQPMKRHFLGLPIGVGMSADLGRKISDAEWERIVVDLRETFDARGKLSQEGSFRQWTNGNLHALLEPTPAGHRLRLRTIKGDARGMIAGGIAMFGFAVVTGGAALLGGGVDDTGMITSITTLAAAGAAMFGITGLRLPGWARTRMQQMEGIIARIGDGSSAT